MIAIEVRRVPNVGWRVFSIIEGREKALSFFGDARAANAEAELLHAILLDVWRMGRSDGPGPAIRLAEVPDGKS